MVVSTYSECLSYIGYNVTMLSREIASMKRNLEYCRVKLEKLRLILSNQRIIIRAKEICFGSSASKIIQKKQIRYLTRKCVRLQKQNKDLASVISECHKIQLEEEILYRNLCVSIKKFLS